MKGIILAGGQGSRLFPLTQALSKQLMPVYDKPMIYYPLSVLMLAGIREILIISTPDHLPQFERLLGDGAQIGMSFNFAPQMEPEGIADAFIIGQDFIGKDNVGLILGDNIFFGHGLIDILREAVDIQGGATIFGYWVRNPEHYGVIEFDDDDRAIGIEEKPIKPKSNYVVPGLYFYDNQVLDIVRELKPSDRNELEISDVNHVYLSRGQLTVKILGRGIAWLDTGTHEALIQASNFVQTVQERQGLMVACIEEIAYRLGYLDGDRLEQIAGKMPSNGYRDYLFSLLRSPWRGLYG
jgi:glucose-1-phosphate thymidylyltransferase